LDYSFCEIFCLTNFPNPQNEKEKEKEKKNLKNKIKIMYIFIFLYIKNNIFFITRLNWVMVKYE